jgi:hypothetical protein
VNQEDQDAAILKRVTERTWTTEEMCAEMDTFNREELPRLNKIVDGANEFLKKHQTFKFYHCSTDRDEK